MAQDDDKAQRGPEAYEPPRVIAEEVFETLSLTCGKTTPTTPDCDPAEGGSLNLS